jgi:hypothetical protein
VWRPSSVEGFLRRCWLAEPLEYLSPSFDSTLLTVRRVQMSKESPTTVGIGDNASWMYIPCLTDWDATGMYSWGFGVLNFLYRHLCEASPGFTAHVHRRLCVLVPAVDVVLSTHWPAHNSCSTSVVRHGHPSTPIDGFLLMGPGERIDGPRGGVNWAFFNF